MNKTRNYEVYFEVFGKKMKTTILAESEDDAKKKVLDKVVFHKAGIRKNDAFNESMDILQNTIDILT